MTLPLADLSQANALPKGEQVMANLSEFSFTTKSDNAESLSTGWTVPQGIYIRTLEGNDSVSGSSASASGILLDRSSGLDTDEGNDTLYGNSTAVPDYRYRKRAGGIVLLDSSLATGTGNDNINSNSKYDSGLILYDSNILAGQGNDNLRAHGFYNGVEAWNSYISMDPGNDLITGQADIDTGVRLESTLVDMGAGNDQIYGSSGSYAGFAIYGSQVITGEGADVIQGNASFAGIILVGGSYIDTGDGNDVITGSGSYAGILLYGNRIDTGSGNDRVDALTGGFLGTGYIDLDLGNDTVVGFGEVTLDGGEGRDKLLLAEGDYLITNGSQGFEIFKDSILMVCASIEDIGSALSGNTVELMAGTLSVAADGTLGFA